MPETNHLFLHERQKHPFNDFNAPAASIIVIGNNKPVPLRRRVAFGVPFRGEAQLKNVKSPGREIDNDENYYFCAKIGGLH